MALRGQGGDRVWRSWRGPVGGTRVPLLQTLPSPGFEDSAAAWLPCVTLESRVKPTACETRRGHRASVGPRSPAWPGTCTDGWKPEVEITWPLDPEPGWP